jgi:hypothetical protein
VNPARPAHERQASGRTGRAPPSVEPLGTAGAPLGVREIVGRVNEHLEAIQALLHDLQADTAGTRPLPALSSSSVPPELRGLHAGAALVLRDDLETQSGLWTIEDVAAYLRRSVRAVRGLRARGQLPAPEGPGRRLLWSAEKIKQTGRGRVSSRAPIRSPR